MFFHKETVPDLYLSKDINMFKALSIYYKLAFWGFCRLISLPADYETVHQHKPLPLFFFASLIVENWLSLGGKFHFFKLLGLSTVCL